ncbi:hypothetical protein DERF_001282 [Dermatophagoides farinae]|uniref:Uncharacterized protein n=1 Tax=Dermatophagoides farinae TaxID=6954 RepID=A0A922IAJ4_DERFA|nr:hypothetical protein DERF_001282 [Dermatophagoides farinae]
MIPQKLNVLEMYFFDRCSSQIVSISSMSIDLSSRDIHGAEIVIMGFASLGYFCGNRNSIVDG